MEGLRGVGLSGGGVAIVQLELGEGAARPGIGGGLTSVLKVRFGGGVLVQGLKRGAQKVFDFAIGRIKKEGGLEVTDRKLEFGILHSQAAG